MLLQRCFIFNPYMINSQSMKTKNKPHFLLMACIVAVIAAFTVSCNKDDDPSLADLREDKLQYLQDSLRISDSLRLIGNAGVVNYAIAVVDGSTSSIFQNGRTEKTQSVLADAIVTISQYGKTVTDTTDASGMVVFNGFFRSAATVTIEKTGFTQVTYISGVHIQDSTRTGTISFVGNLIPLFPTTGAGTATIKGKMTIQTNLTNATRENVPTGTTVSVGIDASQSSTFSNKFLTTALDDEGRFVSSCGCQFVYVGNILQAAYTTGVVGTTDANGEYTVTVPAAMDELPLAIRYSDVVADQTLYESTGNEQKVLTNRTIYTTSSSAQALPAGSTVTIGFSSFDVAASATAFVSANGLGTLDRIDLTAPGTGYTTAPAVQITGGGGTGATATATIANGVVTGINLTAAGTGYTGVPTVTIVSGKNAAATPTLASDGTVTAVAIANSGAGYVTAPTVTFSAPGGTGTLATGTANIDAAGRVTSVTITNPGSGYAAVPTVGFSVSPTGNNATGNVIFSGRSVLSVNITNNGQDYFAGAPTVTFSAPERSNGVRATGTATVDATTGIVTSITVTNPGSGYINTPTIALTSASGATAVAVLTGGQVTAINVDNQGLNYVGTPIVTLTGGGGAGATATATLVGGKVTAITVTNPGKGYTGAPTVTLDAGDHATAFAVVGADGRITGITVTDGGRNFTGAPRVTITGSSTGGGATATATVTNGKVDNNIVITNPGSGYLPGNQPATAQGFSSTKGTTLNAKPGLTYVNDVYYGTGTVRNPN
jgi:hypothetical protein